MHGAYTKSALKRAISSLSAKDLRKAVETLFKRVDKHFNDPSIASAENAEVLETVWKACEQEVLRMTREWRSLIAKCYPQESVNLEFTQEDVGNAFKRAAS